MTSFFESTKLQFLWLLNKNAGRNESQTNNKTKITYTALCMYKYTYM